jgi:HK97 family phage portal protein
MSEKKPGIFTRLRRAALGVPAGWGSAPSAAIGHPEDLLKEISRGARSTAGVYVTPESAMKVSTVFACVKVISEDLSTLPLNVYRKLKPRGREAAEDHALQRILHDQANYWQTAQEFRELMMNWVLLRGRAYALKARVRGKLDELLPIPYDHVRPVKTAQGVVYEVQPENGGAVITYAAKDIFCLVGVGGGRSVIGDAQDTIGLAAGEHQHASENYRDGGLTRIALEHPGQLSEGAGGRLRNSWVETYGGGGKHAKPAILEEGMKANKIGLTAEELQFLEGRQFSVEDIARFFRVSPHKIGHLERATNNNIEELSIDHVSSTLRPWAVRWESRIKMDLLDPATEREYFAKHVFDALLRGDPEKRHKTYQSGILSGYYSPNDVREKEDMNPRPGGDVYLVPSNMQDGTKPLPAPGEPGAAPAPARPQGDSPDA